MDREALENRFGGLSYEELAREMAPLHTSELICLLDSASRRIGDTASSLLSSRSEADAVIDAILNGSVARKIGKIRALHCLGRFGKRVHRAVEMYLRLIHDKSVDVVAGALFNLTLWQDRRVLPEIKEAMRSFSGKAEFEEWFEKAIRSLEESDPYLYLEYFRDESGIWNLPPKKKETSGR